MKRIFGVFLAAGGTVALSGAGGCGGDDRSSLGGNADPGKTSNGDGSFVIEDDGGRSPRTGSPTTCAGAAESRSYIGCDYWPTVLANNVWDIFDFAVVVANGQDVDAEITIGGALGAAIKETVPAGGLKKFYLPWVKELKGKESDSCATATPLPGSIIAKNGAYHLESSVPVSVFQFNALEYKGEGGPPGKDWAACPGNKICSNFASPNFGVASGCFSFTNDASLLLPSSAWTGTYRVTGQQGLGTETQGVGSYFSVVAASDDTKVTVSLPSLQQALPGTGITGTNALTFTLNHGDVAQIVAPPGDNHDLSGSLVRADKPVQVLAGTPCSIAGDPKLGVTCDHIEESVFPAETLGQHYVVAPPTSPGGKPVGHVVRFYGNVDGTKLTYAPSKPAGCPATLSAGQVARCTGTVTSAFEVTGDHEFAVGGFMLSGIYQDPASDKPKGDPAQTLMAAVEQFRTKYIFLAPDDYDENWVDIVAPSDATVTLDNATVNDTGTAIANDFVVIRAKLGAGKDGAHTLTATKPVGIQVMGFGAFTSYHYPGGLDLNQIAPTPVK